MVISLFLVCWDGGLGNLLVVCVIVFCFLLVVFGWLWICCFVLIVCLIVRSCYVGCLWVFVGVCWVGCFDLLIV